MTTKTDLAYHYGHEHFSADGKRRQVSTTPTAKVLRWRREEIENAHRDMHERLGTPVEPEYRS